MTSNDHVPHPAPVSNRDFWEGRASEFSEYAASTGYPERFIDLMDIEPHWTVLDMACGGGTLAIPLATRVKAVTAVDFSSNMLAIVMDRSKQRGLGNVRTIQGRWEDDWDSLGIDTYDVAIASRSLIGNDLPGLIRKLDGAARRRVYISTLVGDGPFDRRLFEATGRQFKIGQDYIYYYDMLYGMGIRAGVAFIQEDHRNTWKSHEEALEDQRWMFHGMTKAEEQKAAAYLKEHLIPVNGQWRLPYSRRCHWAVMWWSKD
jgi:SAM-dependent methyltransferase